MADGAGRKALPSPAHVYIGLTPGQADALTSVLALVMNDPDWVYQPGQRRAIQGAFTAICKASSREAAA